jgi:SAM-dependent methyltransferase
MTDATHYAIRGGIEGRERLRVLGRVMHDTSTSLFDRLGLRAGLSCVDVGCGGGDATLELARRVAPDGRVLGLDIDRTKLEVARAEAEQQGITNVEFQLSDIRERPDAADFDVVYARFLLTHLSDPGAAAAALYRHLRPGGRLAVEDIDFAGYFSYPESKALERYRELYCAAVRNRGGDPDIGPRLPWLLRQAGVEDLRMNVVQPIGMSGEVKVLNPLTMENIADAVIADGLATREEVDDIVRELYAFAARPDTLAGTPRIVQVWGRRPAA